MQSVAIVFIHSYLYDKHEVLVGDLCKDMGFNHISLSSQYGFWYCGVDV